LGLLEKAYSITTESEDATAAELRMALIYAETALEMGPDDDEGRYLRGLARLRLGQLVAARDDLEVSARQGGDPASFGLLALAEIQLGHRPEAESALSAMNRRVARSGFNYFRSIPVDLQRKAESLILDAIFPADPFVP